MKFYEYILIFVLALVTSFVIKTYFIGNIEVPSGSMIPTISPGERFFVDMTIKPEELKHNDILVFYPPVEKTRYIKRLIGLPGDVIEVKGGYLYRNGKQIKESYLKEKPAYVLKEITVPEHEYFFLGDNRNDSYDSHMWSPMFVKEDQILGKAIYRYYPFNRMGSVK